MTKPIASIAAEWAAFEASVLRNNTPSQKAEKRRLFYCGAISTMNVILAVAQTPGVTEDEALRHLDEVRDEILRFGEEAIAKLRAL